MLIQRKMKINNVVDFLETSSIFSKDDVSLIILGGSRGCGYDNECSDYDLNLYLRDQPKKWECCMNTYGFVKMGKYTVHWYSHPRDLSLVNIPAEIFYYAKMPLQKEECFLPCDDIGQKYMNFLKRNANDISLFFLKKLFDCLGDTRCGGGVADGLSSSPKWYYGLMLLANYFELSNYSREEILECKSKKIPPIETKEGMSGIRKLESWVINTTFESSSLLEENKKWNQ